MSTSSSTHTIQPVRSRALAIALVVVIAIGIVIATIIRATSSAASAVATATPTVHEFLTIVPGEMDGSKNGPSYLPSSFTLPAHSHVIVTITDLDTATPLTGASVIYDKVTGVTNNQIAVTPIDVNNPNGSNGVTKTYSTVDPNIVGHTFTIAQLGLNVPVPGTSRVTFSFNTGAPGVYSWRCNDPCGTGEYGWSGAMVMKGYMEGTIRVQ